MSVQPNGRAEFSASRDNDFLKLDELVKLTGAEPARFGDVITKELLDNALDAAEMADRRPTVQVHLSDADDPWLTITVTDNGPGFPDGSVGKILDFSNRTSTKAKYRTPTRGQQGNAMMTVVGIASVLGGRPVIIESQGFRHSLCATLVGERLEKTHNRTVVPEREGTTVSVTIDSRRLLSPVERSVRVARGFALGNPHATIELSTPASPAPCTYAATASDKWRK